MASKVLSASDSSSLTFNGKSLLSRPSFSWLLAAYAKAALLSSLSQGLRRGSLVIFDQGDSYRFGNLILDEDADSVVFQVKSPNFWTRIYLSHDLGFAEAYMNGEFEASSLRRALNLWLDNRTHLSELSSFWNRCSVAFSSLYICFLGQSLGNAKLNVVTGYEVDNEFFKSFLSRDMTYSCAIWPESAGGVRGDLTSEWQEGDLEAAQLYKIRNLISKARLRPGDRLLEFGTGWGALAIEAAKMGCQVDTLTLSVNQKAVAEQRVAALSLQDRVRVHLLDYRNMPGDFEHAFDAFISVEMVEAVGAMHLGSFFKLLDWALKRHRAAAVITATTQPEWRFKVLQPDDYARRYQWPNSFIPSATYFLQVAEAATKGSLTVESVENFGSHYPRTLREWGRRFSRNWGNEELMASLAKSQPQLLRVPGALEAFKRKWEYLWVYAEVGYARAYTSMHHFTFMRPEFVSVPCD
ncbi:CFS1-like protein [Guyanagaster necrorhizus]|uniref:CFS1-like protein n=1 Tax=Guyanagaster necrorhizus TaxID=856835 RepID=A0A9P8ASB6_9AGAR|nr:CFS1-like protein [Guyanagaster necrorhizus MCA 3950]KAG7446119.1 CFS1-like protein [Guyanagaster necrorhizus MCA 3950]